jgi:photosystem II stability/assembly factor-like uncharacterized protein
MMALMALVCWTGQLLVSGLTAVDPAVIPDDLVSASCVGQGSCWALDEAGNLWFSPDSGAHFEQRSRLPNHALTRIRFTGLLTGFALDRRGGPWRTRDGGRHWEVRPAGEPPGHPDLVPLDPAAGFPGAQGRRWTTACRGEVKVSPDGGQTWRALPAPPGAWTATCPRPLAELEDGRLVLAGLPGELLLAASDASGFERLEGDSDRIWREAAALPSGLLLVGDGGARGRLRLESGKARLEVLAPTPGSLLALGCLPNGKAYRLHAGGALWLGREAGQTWESAPAAPPELRKLVFLDDRLAYGLEANRVVASQDAGRSWSTLGRWDNLSLTGLAFQGRTRLLVVGEGGLMLRSSDGGKSWTQDRLATSHSLLLARWADAKTVWVAGEKQAIFRSQDGGSTFTQLRSGRGELTSLWSLDARRIWVGGVEGLVLATSDGGATLAASQLPTTEPIQDLVFLDARRGLLAAGRAGLFRTTDGGRSWQAWPLPTRVGVSRVACWPKPRRCLVGGERGLLLAGDPFRGPMPSADR